MPNSGIKASLISSFGAFREGRSILENSLWELYQQLGVAVDVYSFMQSDSTNVQLLLGNDLTATASGITLLGKLNVNECSTFCAELHRLSSEHRVPIRAFSSFLPEISDAAGDMRAEGIRALTNLLYLSMLIGEQQKTPPPVIQIVSGSRAQAIIFDDSEGELNLNAELSDEDTVYQSVVKAIKESIENAQGRNCEAELPRIALELENGPLFPVRNLQTIEKIVSVIQGYEEEGELPEKKIGLNLDIAHWYMAGIQPSQVSETIKNRVFHAHISGHSKQGHIGDFSLACLNDEEKSEYLAWIDFLKNLPENSWSGYISLEYEAAKNDDVVIESVQTLQSWL